MNNSTQPTPNESAPQVSPPASAASIASAMPTMPKAERDPSWPNYLEPDANGYPRIGGGLYWIAIVLGVFLTYDAFSLESVLRGLSITTILLKFANLLFYAKIEAMVTLVFTCYIIYMFGKKSKRFPALFKLYTLYYFFVKIGSSYLAYTIFSNASYHSRATREATQMAAQTLMSIGLFPLICMLVLFWYICVSERVKYTFVK